MATVIQIKRSSGSTAPTTSQLSEAELAYTQDASNNGASAKLYIESVDSGASAVIHEVGGKYFTDIINAATDSNTANTLVKRDGSGNFNGGTITGSTLTDGTLSAASGAITGATNITASGTVQFGSISDGTITVTAFVDEDNMVSDSATLIPTQQSVKAYVDSVAAAAYDLDFSGDSGTGVIEQAETLAITGATGITTAASGNGLSIDLDDTAVTPGSYGSTTSVPVITVDQQGRLTSASTASIATSFTISDNAGTPVTDTFNNGETLTFAGGTGVTTAVTNNTVTFSLGQAVATTDNVTFNDLAVSGNATVTGNLTVNGTTTTLSTTNSVISDTLIELGNGTTGAPANDTGIVLERGDSDNAFIGFDESADKFIVGTGSFTGASTGNLTITTGTLVANLEDNNTAITGGSITGITDLAVADGGTGVSTFTSNGVLYGNGASALNVTAAGTEGQLLVANASGVPVFADIDCGTF